MSELIVFEKPVVEKRVDKKYQNDLLLSPIFWSVPSIDALLSHETKGVDL